ncbi:MAG TPA: hypothetical protein VJ860_14730 [Polyangia bacterium]|jgi:hypothetical protein|nr:hypothetical protein [Polyangia bacterium]
MARPVEHIAKTLEEALMALKHDPSHPVHACVDDLDVELRVVGQAKAEIPLGDFMAEGGGWKGESPEEILRILREARAAGTSSEPPKL